MIISHVHRTRDCELPGSLPAQLLWISNLQCAHANISRMSPSHKSQSNNVFDEFSMAVQQMRKRRRWLHRLESLVASKSGCFRKDSTYLGLVPEGLSDGHATRMEWNSGRLATSHGWEDEEPRLPSSIQDDRLIVAASMFGWQ